MSDLLQYWVDIDFGSDHCIVKCDGNPSFYTDYSDRYFDGPFPTLAGAKGEIRSASRIAREAISDKLNYWMDQGVADIMRVERGNP